MIILTGAAGFIGSCLLSFLNLKGHTDIVIVDEFGSDLKGPNLDQKRYNLKVSRDSLENWLYSNEEPIEAIIHIGARTDTTEFDKEVFDRLNLNYSKMLFAFCSKKDIPFIYASSAATYGGGEFGYDDNHSEIAELKPLNPYGQSKQDFDLWLLSQEKKPSFWAGLKFFNIYGPNEYHKGRMASVVYHAFNQINISGKLKLFKSHKSEFKDGEQLRDFCYVKDVVKVIYFMLLRQPKSGIYNLGTGKARTFKDLGEAVFKFMNRACQIDFIDTPIDIRDKYQYFTEAKMSKLRGVGFKDAFFTLEEGIEDYIVNYLTSSKYY